MRSVGVTQWRPSQDTERSLSPGDAGEEEQGLTWSRSITEDLMISLHFWSSVSWYFCWDSKSWAHSVCDWGNLWGGRRGPPAAGVMLSGLSCALRPLKDKESHQSVPPPLPPRGPCPESEQKQTPWPVFGAG